jgi:hypothetical protein
MAYANSPEECAANCKAETGCFYFLFDPNDGECKVEQT